MKKAFISLIICTLICITSCRNNTNAWIRINQLGYRINDIKVAVFISKKNLTLQSFKVIEVNSGEVVMTFKNVVKTESLEPFISCYRLPFSDLKKSGVYRIVAGNIISNDDSNF